MFCQLDPLLGRRCTCLGSILSEYKQTPSSVPPPTTADCWLLPCALHPPTSPEAVSRLALCIPTTAQGVPFHLGLFPLVGQEFCRSVPSDICIIVINPTHSCTHTTPLQCWPPLDWICHASPVWIWPLDGLFFFWPPPPSRLPMSSVFWVGI